MKTAQKNIARIGQLKHPGEPGCKKCTGENNEKVYSLSLL